MVNVRLTVDVTEDLHYTLIEDQGISGKAMYVAQYFQQIGVPLAASKHDTLPTPLAT